MARNRSGSESDSSASTQSRQSPRPRPSAETGVLDLIGVSRLHLVILIAIIGCVFTISFQTTPVENGSRSYIPALKHASTVAGILAGTFIAYKVVVFVWNLLKSALRLALFLLLAAFVGLMIELYLGASWPLPVSIKATISSAIAKAIPFWDQISAFTDTAAKVVALVTPQPTAAPTVAPKSEL